MFSGGCGPLLRLIYNQVETGPFIHNPQRRIRTGSGRKSFCRDGPVPSKKTAAPLEKFFRCRAENDVHVCGFKPGGMKMDDRKLKEGGLLLAVFIGLLVLTVYIPFLGFMASFFLALPFILFSAKYERKDAALFLAVSLLSGFLAGGFAGLSFAFLYGLTGVTLGDFIRKRKTRMAGFIAGSLVFLVVLVIQYIASIVFFDTNIIKDLLQGMEQRFHRSLDIVELPGTVGKEELAEQIGQLIKIAEILIPSFFVVISFAYVLMIQLVSFPIASRFLPYVPKWKPLREWVLPRSLLWYYLIVLLISLFVPLEQESYLYAAVLNLSFVLQLLMFIQGLSFIFYFFHVKNQPVAVPVLITAAVFIFPAFSLPLVRILGIIDLGFRLREKLKT